MRFNRIISALLALLLISAAFTFTASAASPDLVDSTRLMQKMAKAKLGTPEGTLQYRIYRSPGYDVAKDNKPATLILYLHDEGGKGEDNTAQLTEKGLLNQLVSDSADKLYKDYQYIVVAPQCPVGKSFADSDMILLLEELRCELLATEILTSTCIVMGVGTGANGAFEYAENFLSGVARVVSVGGTPDKIKLLTAVSSGLTLMTFAEDNNTAVNDFISYAKSRNEDGYITYVKGGSSLASCIDTALAYDEPSITEWAVKDAYESRYFKISARCTEGGGKISASPDNVKYGGNSSVVLTLEKGYAITGLTVDGSVKDVALLEQTTNNKNQYTYNFMGVTEAHSIFVELSMVGGEGDKAEFIDSLILWLTVLSAVLIMAAAVVAAVSMAQKRKQA